MQFLGVLEHSYIWRETTDDTDYADKIRKEHIDRRSANAELPPVLFAAPAIMLPISPPCIVKRNRRKGNQ